jgi:hypothetical protein
MQTGNGRVLARKDDLGLDRVTAQNDPRRDWYFHSGERAAEDANLAALHFDPLSIGGNLRELTSGPPPSKEMVNAFPR